MSEMKPRAWRYRYVGDEGPLSWKLARSEESCIHPRFEREPLYSADALAQAREDGRREALEDVRRIPPEGGKLLAAMAERDALARRVEELDAANRTLNDALDSNTESLAETTQDRDETLSDLQALLPLARAAMEQLMAADAYGRSVQAGVFSSHVEDRFKSMHEAVERTCAAASRLDPAARERLKR